MQLRAEPDAETVSRYVLTASATRAWDAVNRHSGSRSGALFWIGGAQGIGKTHFLNYVLTLERKAGARSMDEERHLALALDLSASEKPLHLEAALLESLARELGGRKREAPLWHGLGQCEGLRVALNEAFRLGVRRLTLALDFAECDPSPAFDYFQDVSAMIESVRRPATTILVAARGVAPSYAVSLDVSPRDAAEATLIAAACTRELAPAAYDLLDDFYGDVQGAREKAFPFHFAALRALAALAPSDCGIGGLARLARAALSGGEHNRNLALRRLILPSDLTASGVLARRVESLLGAAGRAALRAGWTAALSSGGDDAQLAQRVVDSLALAYLEGRSTGLDELCSVLPGPVGELAPRVGALLERLTRTTKGAIRLDNNGARFIPQPLEGHKLATFNAALPALRRLDPSLTRLEAAEEHEAMMQRLRASVGEALELARDVGEKLSKLAHAEHSQLQPQHGARLNEFVAVVGRGPQALVEMAANPQSAKQLIEQFEAFRALTAAAALAPRVLAMREYVKQTGLLDGDDSLVASATDPQVSGIAQEQLASDSLAATRESTLLAALRMQARLLAAELNFRLAFSSRSAFDAAEGRFAKFRAEYAQHYRAAHAQRYVQAKRLSQLAQEGAALLDVLKRLNSIVLLGPAEGEGLTAEFSSNNAQLVTCDEPDGGLSDEAARCVRCGYVLGANPPMIEHTLGEIRRVVQGKLTRLSQSAIRRLIKTHDQAGRLEGFLKIVQATQTEALARVLDDELTEYLRHLLDEPPNSEARSGGPQAQIAGPGKTLFHRQGGARGMYQRASASRQPTAKPAPRRD